MRTIKLTISYDGTDYVGWQRQPNGLSVQQCVEMALMEMTGGECPVIGAGRTDAGVHAVGQVAHFKADSTIPCHGFVGGLNSLLPESIIITSAADVENRFHARRDAKGKIYRYVIALFPHRTPLLANRCWQLKEPLNLDAMRKASSHLIGKNDYESFRAAGCTSKHAIREIKRIDMFEVTPSPIPLPRGGRVLSIDFEGDGFVRHMIRNIVGTLVDIGLGKIASDDIKAILNARQREEAGRCAPASGLYLVRVIY